MIIYTQHTPYCEQLLAKGSVFYRDDCAVTSGEIVLVIFFIATAIALVYGVIAMWRCQ